MISLLVWVLVLVIIVGLLVWIIRQLPIEEPYKSIAMAIVAVICILILLAMLLGEIPMMRPITVR